MDFLFINVNHDVGYESSESIPISTGYILAALKAQGQGGIIIDDLRDRPLTLKSLEKWIRRMNPHVIGFTAYQSSMNRIRFLCRYIKSRHRKILVVLGGPQIAVMPSAALVALEDVDALVRGEGETVLPEMARILEAGGELDRVEGISCICNGRIVDTGPGLQPPEQLDAYPSPYLTGLLNLEGKNTAIMLSSRGCKHVCRFCITPRICGGKIRYHSVERVLDEMRFLADRGIERFWFADPNFTENRERTERLLDEKIRLGIATPFWFQTRTDLVDASLLKKLHQAGADTVAFGLESGSPSVLEKTNKKIELDQLAGNIAIAQSLGLDVELFTIFGLPGETVEDVRQTLEFVRSMDIPVQSNSGSQQMQLYFGSIYEKNPEAFGIEPLDTYRPAYVSVGDQYTTSSMTRQDVRKARNMWALANEQMERDVYYKQRIFEVLDFLLENRTDLQEDPSFCTYGALSSAAIEEFGLLEMFLQKCGDESAIEELLSALHFFQETDEPAGPDDRVIFDSRSWIDGVPFTGISGKYWDVLLGRGLLLESFEKGFNGVRSGQEIRFSFVFPDDYVQEELRLKQVEVQAKIHKVFKSPRVRSSEDLKNLRIGNVYRFPDLDFLRDQNEILYYLALRDADRTSLLKTPSHFLTLVHKLAKLGKRDEIGGLAGMLDGKPTALNALADTLVAAGKCAWAMEYYKTLSREVPSTVLKQVRCLLNMGQSEAAMKMMEYVAESPDLEFQETLLACLKAARPDSNRIPSLEHHVLDLKVMAALGREQISKAGTVGAAPLVHGGPIE
ncbi:MAG TPA: radical SAM protein [Desulfomonilaceae bacterium]|nr:radical SAM protein [Desulfomonilaceae bacterium]